MQDWVVETERSAREAEELEATFELLDTSADSTAAAFLAAAPDLDEGPPRPREYALSLEPMTGPLEYSKRPE